jgi:predicted aconitase with swiveling domain
MERMIRGRTLVAGSAGGELVASTEPLSFWGGYDPETGEIIDRRHPLSGTLMRGKILMIPASRGSSTTSAVLLEAIRRGTAPAGIVLTQADTFIALAGVVADALYGEAIPMVRIDPRDWEALTEASEVRLTEAGEITWESREVAR